MQKGKVPCFPVGSRIELNARFQPGRALHIFIVTGPATVPGWDLNPQNKYTLDCANKARLILISESGHLHVNSRMGMGKVLIV